MSIGRGTSRKAGMHSVIHWHLSWVSVTPNDHTHG